MVPAYGMLILPQHLSTVLRMADSRLQFHSEYGYRRLNETLATYAAAAHCSMLGSEVPTLASLQIKRAFCSIHAIQDRDIKIANIQLASLDPGSRQQIPVTWAWYRGVPRFIYPRTLVLRMVL